MDKTLDKFSFASYTEKDNSERIDRKGFVSYGKDNDFPQYLENLYMTSPTHHALVDSIAYMIAGKDIEVDGLQAKLAVAKFRLNDLKGYLSFDLKLHGAYAIEVIKDKKGDVSSFEHLPMCNLRPSEVDDEGVVNHWYYCEDWTDRKLLTFALENPIEALDESLKQTKCIIVVKTPTPNGNYFSKPDYIGARNYIELEKEISTFHVNNIKNGLFPSAFLIWKNGIPTEEERRRHSSDMERDLSGAQNAGKIVNLYASDSESAPEIVAFESNDADNTYQFLSNETTNKIMIGHRVTTPSLFGVKTAGQLGNVQEMETGSVIFESNVIEPFRELVQDGLELCLRLEGITDEVDIPSNNKLMPEETANVEQSFTGIQISSAVDIIAKVGLGELTVTQAKQLLISMLSFTEDSANALFENKEELSKQQTELETFLESIDDDLDGYVEVDDEDASEETEDFNFEDALNEEALKFASTGTARPNANSEQDITKDGVKYKVRYYYAGSEAPEREFCKKMKGANKLYRKEDILQMGTKSVNKGWGPKGAATYSIWLYKGGGNCYHKWFRKIFVAEGVNVDVNSPNATVISTTKARSKGVKPEANDTKVSVAPIDMPKQGFLSSIREYFRNNLKKKQW